MFIYFRRGGGGQEGERGRKKIWSADSAEPDVKLKPTNCEIMTWAEVWYLTDWATQVLQEALILIG